MPGTNVPANLPPPKTPSGTRGGSVMTSVGGTSATNVAGTGATTVATAGTTTVATTNVRTPRVGGVDPVEKIAWTGGSNVKPAQEPFDINCFRPTGFRNLRSLTDTIKAGLPKERRLGADGVTPMTFVQQLRAELEALGLDTVFRVIDSAGAEVYLLQEWGKLTMAEVKDWVKRLENGTAPWPRVPGKQGVCMYDIKNLQYSYQVCSNAISSDLYGQLAAELTPSCPGPVYFMQIMQRSSGTNPQAVRELTHRLEEMQLSSEPSENVSKFGKRVIEVCKQIIGAGTSLTPQDLTFLAARTFEHSTDARWISFVNNIVTEEQRLCDSSRCLETISNIIAHYDGRISANDWPPGRGTKSKKESEEDSIVKGLMGHISELTAAVGQLQQGDKRCFGCQELGHVLRDCLHNKSSSSDPRKIPPKAGEPTSKVIDGSDAQWCAKCQRGSGYWTMGRSKHGTADHKPGYWKERRQPTGNTSSNGNATNTTAGGNLGAVDYSGLEFLNEEVVGGFMAVSTNQTNADDDSHPVPPAIAPVCAPILNPAASIPADFSSLMFVNEPVLDLFHDAIAPPVSSTEDDSSDVDDDVVYFEASSTSPPAEPLKDCRGQD